MTTGIDRQRVTADLAREWLSGLSGARRAEGERLLGDLVAGWAEEADATPDPNAVLRFQRSDLEAAGAGRDANGRLEALRLIVLRRAIDRLGAETYALGVAILDAKVGGEEARGRGRDLLDRAEALAPGVKALPQNPEAVPLRRELNDAVMEALFAVEGKAMSPRLERERQQRAGH